MQRRANPSWWGTADENFHVDPYQHVAIRVPRDSSESPSYCGGRLDGAWGGTICARLRDIDKPRKIRRRRPRGASIRNHRIVIKVTAEEKTTLQANAVAIDPTQHTNLGVYWTYEEAAAKAHWGAEGSKVEYRARIDKSNINKASTILANTVSSTGSYEKEVQFYQGVSIWVYSAKLPNGRVLEINDWRTT